MSKGGRWPSGRCGRCGREGPLGRVARGAEPALCKRCYRSVQPRRRCGRCGRVGQIAIRAKGSEPDICVSCRPRAQAPCGICGRIGPITIKASETSPAIGRCCYRPPVATCGACGKERPCYRAAGPEPICPSCASARRKRACLDCGRARRPARRVPGGVVCQGCAWRRGGACENCGELARLRGARCAGCRLRAQLTQLAADADPRAARRLAPYLASLAAAPNAESTLRWTFTPTFALVRDLLAGRTEISHIALDARAAAARPPSVRVLAFLRAGLLDAGVLQERDQITLSFERWLEEALARLPEGRDRALVAAYARWEIGPRLGRPPGFRRARPQLPQKYPRSLVTEAIKLSAWLAEQGLGLADLRQDLLDSWVGAGASTRRRVRLFCAWLARDGTSPPLRVDWAERGPSPGPMPEERRLAALRSLLHEDRAQAPERLAGCLLLLFGQPLTRSAALRVADVNVEEGRRVTIALGRGSVPLPQPLGALALELRGRALRRGDEEAWLFPGRIAGAHLSAETLGRRLRRHGISAKAARHAALLELGARLPAPILAERFGFHQARAAQWVRAAGDTYAEYVALRSRP